MMPQHCPSCSHPLSGYHRHCPCCTCDVRIDEMPDYVEWVEKVAECWNCGGHIFAITHDDLLECMHCNTIVGEYNEEED